MKEKTNPVQFLLEHQDVILGTYQSKNRSPKAAWDSLTETLPEINQAMTFNTFKQYITPFVSIINAVTPRLRGDGAMNIDGWTVNQGKDGYYRLFKKKEGRLFCLYGGKTLNMERIREKIREKEKIMASSEAEI